MRAAPLKGDCIICQSPEPTRVAINQAIWPKGEPPRSVTYRADAQAVAKASRVPELENLNRKTVTRHADHVEMAWRVLPANGRLADDEVPVATDFGSVMERGARLGMKAMATLEDAIDQLGPAAFAYFPKEVIAIAKLGIGASSTRESSRLKGNQQAIDVMALFAASSGHLRRPGEEEDEESLDDLRAEIAEERRLLTAGPVPRETEPDVPRETDDDELPDAVAAAL